MCEHCDDKKAGPRVTMSAKDGEIHAKMASILADVEAVGKDGRNDFSNYNYRRIEDVMTAVHEAMAKHGVYMLPGVVESKHTATRTQKGDAATHCILTNCYRFIASDGSYVETTAIGESIDKGDKATSQANSLCLKYFLSTTFMIPFKGMSDGDSKTTPRGSAQPSGGNGKSNGGGKKAWPLLDSLYGVAKELGVISAYDVLDPAMRKMLGLSENERPPKLKDIETPKFKKLALQALLLAFADLRKKNQPDAHAIMKQWLRDTKGDDGEAFESSKGFVDKAEKELATMAHIKSLVKRFDGEPGEPTPSDDQPPPDEQPMPDDDDAIGEAFGAAPVELDEQAIVASLTKRKVTPGQMEKLARAMRKNWDNGHLMRLKQLDDHMKAGLPFDEAVRAVNKEARA